MDLATDGAGVRIGMSLEGPLIGDAHQYVRFEINPSGGRAGGTTEMTLTATVPGLAEDRQPAGVEGVVQFGKSPEARRRVSDDLMQQNPPVVFWLTGSPSAASGEPAAVGAADAGLASADELSTAVLATTPWAWHTFDEVEAPPGSEA
ncbi:MAG: hypothetical protein ABF811_01335 [Pseudoclavibacter sp.]